MLLATLKTSSLLKNIMRHLNQKTRKSKQFNVVTSSELSCLKLLILKKQQNILKVHMASNHK